MTISLGERSGQKARFLTTGRLTASVRRVFLPMRRGRHCWLVQQCEAGTRRPLLDEPAVALCASHGYSITHVKRAPRAGFDRLLFPFAADRLQDGNRRDGDQSPA